ncbi:MAG: glycosyltransferase [Candidatus Dormibacteraeota bacterium]|nr:glycosyltransferase [Candidatus Dormibacteraeota bacterium]
MTAEAARRRPTKVLWFTKGLGRGGTERILASSVRHLDRESFDVEVGYLLPWKDALVQEIEAAGIRVHCLGGAGSGNVSWPLRFRTLVQQGGYEIVHTHMPYPAAVARMVLGRSGPALVHTEHNVWDRFRPLTREANALTLSRNAAVIAVSDAVAQSMEKPAYWPGVAWPRIDVIHHGIDLEGVRSGKESREAARAILGLGPDDFAVGTVGNLTPKKDHRTLLEAVALLVPRYERLRLVVIGDGPLKDEVHGVAGDLGITDRVVFTGSRSDVPDLLPGLDVFALSSRFEGFPISLVEAMASSLACVATCVGGTPELIRDGENGLLVPPSHPEAIVGALTQLIADPLLRQALGQQAATDSLGYSLFQAVERLQVIYSQVLAAR